MAFGREKEKRGQARRCIIAVLAAFYAVSSVLGVLGGAGAGHAAQHFALANVTPGQLSASRQPGGAIDSLTLGRAPAQPSPYAVAQGHSRAPYQTGDWGTIKPGQTYGVNGREDPYGRALSSEKSEAETPSMGRAEQPQEAAQPAPAKAAKAQATEKPVRLFSTVDFRSPLKDMPKWERVLQQEKRQQSFSENGLLCGGDKTVERWKQLKSSLQGASVMEKVKAVNSFFNRWPYRSDKAIWGVEDYWAAPCEFFARSGDCEDYAIAKYFALRSLDLPADIMRIAAVRDTIRGIGHAVLVVYIGNDAYVLDNLSNLVLSHKRLKHYRPLFTVNENYLWRHVKPIAGPDSK